MRISSGTTSIATSGTAAVTLLTLPAGTFSKLVLINEGTTSGFFRVTVGAGSPGPWCRLPVGPGSISLPAPQSSSAGSTTLEVKRDSSDLTGLFAWAY